MSDLTDPGYCIFSAKAAKKCECIITEKFTELWQLMLKLLVLFILVNISDIQIESGPDLRGSYWASGPGASTKRNP
jgi:hypothetical protein